RLLADPEEAFVTGPLSYSTAPLAAQIAASRTLVSPYLLAAVPCARLPVVELGAAQPPELLVEWLFPPLTDSTGPFRAVPDLYQLSRLPLLARHNGQHDLWAYEVGVDPRDAILNARVDV